MEQNIHNLSGKELEAFGNSVGVPRYSGLFGPESDSEYRKQIIKAQPVGDVTESLFLKKGEIFVLIDRLIGKQDDWELVFCNGRIAATISQAAPLLFIRDNLLSLGTKYEIYLEKACLISNNNNGRYKMSLGGVFAVVDDDGVIFAEPNGLLCIFVSREVACNCVSYLEHLGLTNTKIVELTALSSGVCEF